MLLKLNLTNVIWPNDEYSLFSVESLHLFHLRNLKTLTDCTVIYLTLGERHMPPQGNEREGKKRKPNQTKLLHGCSNFQAAYEGSIPMSGLHIDVFE